MSFRLFWCTLLQVCMFVVEVVDVGVTRNLGRGFSALCDHIIGSNLVRLLYCPILKYYIYKMHVLWFCDGIFFNLTCNVHISFLLRHSDSIYETYFYITSNILCAWYNWCNYIGMKWSMHIPINKIIIFLVHASKLQMCVFAAYHMKHSVGSSASAQTRFAVSYHWWYTIL